MGKSEMTYAEAMAEIEAILAKMNEANPDIDALAGQVRRAGELIRFCRGRLRKAEKEVAEALGVANYSTIYEWIRHFRERGATALMGKKEQIEAGVYKTRAQLRKSLPDDPEELKDMAARLLAEKAVLEQELELAKKIPGRHPGKTAAKAEKPHRDEA